MGKILLEYCMAKSTDFELISTIGAGGMGEVYKARLFNDHGFEKIVAAKKLFGSGTDKEVLREAEVLSKLNHANICAVFDLKEYDGHLYILMEYIEGLSLSEIQELSHQKGYQFKEEFILLLGFEILKGLEYAHAAIDDKPAITHRDISPHNIMISSRGEVKILDFGIAKVDRTFSTIMQTPTYGKLRYCAPEVLNGMDYDQRADLYALGVLLFELCVGEKAFDGLTESQIVAYKINSDLDYSLILNKGHSAELMAFIEKLTAIHPDRRFKSAFEAIQYFSQVHLLKSTDIAARVINSEVLSLKNAGIERTKTTHVTTIKKNISKKKYALLVVSVSAVVGLSIFGHFLWISRAPKVAPIVIKIQSDGELVILEGPKNEGLIEVGGEKGFGMAEAGCISAINNLLAFPSNIFDPDIANKIPDFGIKKDPNSLLRTIHQANVLMNPFFNSLRMNCEYSRSFKIGADMYQNLKDVVAIEVKNNFKTFEELRKNLSLKVLYTNQKAIDLYNVEDQLISKLQKDRLSEQITGIHVYDLSTTTKFTLLDLNQEIFPKSLGECRNLLDKYWVHQNLYKNVDGKDLGNFSVVLVPSPLHSELIKYGPFQIEFRDLQKREVSSFRFFGACVYQIKDGEVVESSLRKL